MTSIKIGTEISSWWWTNMYTHLHM
jgi:hypothetical protein